MSILMPLAHTSSQPIPYSPWVHKYSNLGPLVRWMTRWTSWGLPILEAFPHHCLSSPLLSGAVVQLQNTSIYQTNPFMNQNQLVSSFINCSYKIPSTVTHVSWGKGSGTARQRSWGLGYLFVQLACAFSRLCSIPDISLPSQESWALLILWFGGSDQIQLMMGNSRCVIP